MTSMRLITLAQNLAEELDVISKYVGYDLCIQVDRSAYSGRSLQVFADITQALSPTQSDGKWRKQADEEGLSPCASRSASTNFNMLGQSGYWNRIC